MKNQKLFDITASNFESEAAFNWQQCWYPVTFVRDLALDRPMAFSVYDEPFVVFFDGKQLVCLSDRCSHRAAKLSTGQLIDGKIECLYHGWQFGSNGKCVHIPQLAEGARISRQACIPSFKVATHQGIVWMWRGTPETADESLIPAKEEVFKKGVAIIDTVTDLPYSQDYLVENLLDPAHVPISHDRTELKMKREDAQPLEMEILEVSVKGFRGRYRNTKTARMGWANLEFIAPGAVLYSFGNPDYGIIGGLSLYAVPLGQGKSRILVRRYGNFFDWKFKHTPRWLEHLRQNKILEEDLEFIRSQEAYINHSRSSIKETYLPLKSIDTFVMEHRKWLDRFGSELPYYQGYQKAKNINNKDSSLVLNRFDRHTRICSSCSQAYQNIHKLRQTLIIVAFVSIFLSILVKSNSKIEIMLAVLFLVAVSLFWSLGKLKTHFENNFCR